MPVDGTEQAPPLPSPSLPLFPYQELARAARALSYHAFAAAPLTLIAYLASYQGMDLVSSPSLQSIQQGTPVPALPSLMSIVFR